MANGGWLPAHPTRGDHHSKCQNRSMIIPDKGDKRLDKKPAVAAFCFGAAARSAAELAPEETGDEMPELWDGSDMAEEVTTSESEGRTRTKRLSSRCPA